MKYKDALQKVFEIQSNIKDVHPFLEKMYPIAIVKDDYFFIFDVDSLGKSYVFVKKSPTGMPVP